jgi:hypothetical protein
MFMWVGSIWGGHSCPPRPRQTVCYETGGPELRRGDVREIRTSLFRVGLGCEGMRWLGAQCRRPAFDLGPT